MNSNTNATREASVENMLLIADEHCDENKLHMVKGKGQLVEESKEPDEDSWPEYREADFDRSMDKAD